MIASTTNCGECFELRFQSLRQCRGLTFPCDMAGQVDLDALSESARNDYLFARATVGCEYAAPDVRPLPGLGMTSRHRGHMAPCCVI